DVVALPDAEVVDQRVCERGRALPRFFKRVALVLVDQEFLVAAGGGEEFARVARGVDEGADTAADGFRFRDFKGLALGCQLGQRLISGQCHASSFPVVGSVLRRVANGFPYVTRLTYPLFEKSGCDARGSG